MALIGNWRDSHSIQAGARKWGTGVNPVHSIATEGPALIEAKQIYNGPGTEDAGDVDTSLTESHYHYDGDEYDGADALWGYGLQTGTETRPGFGIPTQEWRNQSGDFPVWGPYEGGIPGGALIRDDDIGATNSNTPKETPDEDVAQGWLNKPHGNPGDSRPSDNSQLIMQTSQVQRYQVRAGSQVPSGRANEFDAPISSRVVGKKIKFWSGGQRHYDMEPRAQDPIVRKWWARNAGTGLVSNLQTNDAYESVPRVRAVPPDPYQGIPVGVPPTAQTESTGFGYQGEDVIPFV